MRILLIEDDDVLRRTMQRSLIEAGHHLDCACTYEQAAHFWQVQAYDAVLLDLNLPLSEQQMNRPASGLQLLKNARAQGDRTPVLILTARSRTDERIAGLDAGADDYLGKPFDLGEVEARLRALQRRHLASQDKLNLGCLELDRKSKRFNLNGAALDLPAREFEVLWELMSPPGKVVSKTEMANKLSGFDDLLADNALEAFVSRLRKKLQGSGASIRTLRGLGYVIEPENLMP